MKKIDIKALRNKRCWEIKGCPASHYLNCKAYLQSVNCWEIKAGCLCDYGKLDFSDCRDCSIYADYLKNPYKSDL